MGKTAQDIINWALSQVGYREGANNDNKYGVWLARWKFDLESAFWMGWILGTLISRTDRRFCLGCTANYINY